MNDDTLTRDADLAATRALLTQAIRAVAPERALIDCARLANAAIDAAADGDGRLAAALLDALRGAVEASERARRLQ